ncbi:sensor histidine kinase [Devosia sp.]|uniref:sensor histidine kinase n=1 Tax=Devosia sp. TaxID=1871048 RepID=UPI002AFDE08F|nr:ATP-binding protein [Devosia sp.]
MMDEPYSEPDRASWRSALARLVARAGWLAGIFVVFLALVLVGELKPGGALAGFVLALLGLALLPVGSMRGRRIEAAPSLPAPDEEAAVFAFADALADPCLVLDRRSAVVHANAAASRQFPTLVPGRPITFFLRNPELVQAIDLAMRGAETRAVELHETVPSETWDRVVVSPLRRPGRDWLGDEDRQLVVTFQSLTELKRVEALRSDFIANASHELRTPLASLLGFIDTLLGPAARDAAAREKFLHIMRGQADRMSRLVDDLLSLSRIEMHQHVRPTGSIDLGGLLREVREGLTTQAVAAGVEIRLDLPEGPNTTMGDRGQLYEVFENLIDNAVKYGAAGKFVEVKLARASRAGFQHLITVIDHGPGVEPEHVPRLTERFYRIDADASRKKKGTGLGLAIVKHIVHRHRGLLSIKSKPGEGMRVEVLLP